MHTVCSEGTTSAWTSPISQAPQQVSGPVASELQKHLLQRHPVLPSALRTQSHRSNTEMQNPVGSHNKSVAKEVPWPDSGLLPEKGQENRWVKGGRVPGAWARRVVSCGWGSDRLDRQADKPWPTKGHWEDLVKRAEVVPSTSRDSGVSVPHLASPIPPTGRDCGDRRKWCQAQGKECPVRG